jgi:hypothetical protein
VGRYLVVALTPLVTAIALWSGEAHAGQTPASGGGTAQTQHSLAARAWTVPRTPWGTPDLTGVYTNNNESLVPLERPSEFDGRRIEDFSPGELDEINRRRTARFNDTLTGFGSTLFAGAFDRRNSRPWLIIDPPDGRVPPLTSEAEERLRRPRRGQSSNSIPNGPFDGYEDLGLYDRCITRGIPDSMMPVGYGSNYEISQSKDTVAIRYEMIHEVRVIPVMGEPHVGKHLHLDLGDARGRWEGETLVVESTNFSSRSAFRGATDHLRLTERFTPTARGILEWRVTVTDPHTWTRPWTFASTLVKKDESQRIYEYACHEGNYSLSNILAGARSAEHARPDQ